MTEVQYFQFIQYDACLWFNCKNCYYKRLCDLLDSNGITGVKRIRRSNNQSTVLHINYKISGKEKELIKDFVL